MDIEVLRWFQEVADGATVTEVAEVYLVSQPGVSRALARLEHDVGAPLLQRSGRVLRPTHAGIVFKRHVDALIHDLDDGLAAVNELVDPERGTVTVAFQLSLGAWLIPRAVRGFHAAHPGVDFRLEQSLDVLGSSSVAQGRVDMEFTARRPRNPEVHWEPLLTERLYLAVPPDHLAADRPEMALAEAAEEHFVMLSRDWELRRLCDQLCSAAGFTPHVVFEGDDLPTVGSLVAAGLGVAILPAMGADPKRPIRGAPRLVPLTDRGSSRDLGLAWSNTRRLLPSAALFREFVVSERPW
jgi:DNA-binding transcriptional LysR family regulator